MSTRLAAEALLAVTGIWPKESPTVANLLAAEGLVDRWRGRVKRWMKGEQKPFVWTPVPDETKLHNKVLLPVDHETVTHWLAVLGDLEIGTDYAAALVEARGYLRTQWPVTDIGTIIPDVLPLSTDDLARMWAMTQTLDDPETIIDDLESWTLTADQVTAWSTVYRELSGLVRELMTAEMIENLRLKRTLSWQQEDMVRVIRGLPTEAAIILPPEAEAQVEQKAKRNWEIDFAATRTPSERLGLHES